MLRKKISFWLILILLNISFIEIFGQISYVFLRKKFIWEDCEQYNPLLFNIKPFTKFVDDDRLVTNKKNYSDKVTCGAVKGWEVKIDSQGFRIGTNEYSQDRASIVFLGDSVPFGYCVSGEQSVPSRFYSLIKNRYSAKYGVINAAIPAYSLYQALKRYEYEIDGKFPVKYVILQIFDPVTQFAIWGEKWNEKICWMSNNTQLSFKDVANYQNHKHYLLYKYSFIYRSIYSAILKYKLVFGKNSVSPFDITDREGLDYFEQKNLSILGEFYARLKKNNIVLIILPVNPSRPYNAYRSDELLRLPSVHRSILFIAEKFNEMLFRFAASHKDVYYLDVAGYFDRIGRNAMFIDDCHLTDKGARRQAEFIFKQMQANGLL